MIPFSPPRIDQKILDAVCDTLKSGWITTGPRTKQFEKELTAYTGAKSTICLNSATSGLELILRWFGVGEGDEVILPAYTYCATANVIVHCGAKPVFVDVGDDFNISVDNIASGITDKTKVIMPVDIAGLPCEYNDINELVKSDYIKKKFNCNTEVQKNLGRILVLSDSAHSFGGWYNEERCGSLTDISVFSFHAVKNLSTAEGGAVCLNLPEPFDNEELYQYLCIKSLHGQSKDALAKFQKGGWKYDVIEAGYKCNMTDIQAAIGLVELARYDSETLKRRAEIFELYTRAFSDYQWAQLPVYKTQDKESSYHLYPLRINGIAEKQRDDAIEKITEQGVSVNVHFQPVPMLSVYRNMGYKVQEYPKALDNYSREISLPVYYDLSNEDVEKVIQAVVDSIQQVL